MRRAELLILSGLLLVAWVAGGAFPAGEKASGHLPKIAFILHGTVDDGNWNGNAYQAIQTLRKQGYEVIYIENVTDANVPRVMRKMATEGENIVFGWGGTDIYAVLDIAPSFPEVTFVTAAGPGLSLPANVWSITHEWEDTFFMAGALAGLMTKTNKIGHIGGIPIPIYVACAKAFEAGGKYVNPEIEFYDVFVGDFNDPVGGKKSAKAQIENGADIIVCTQDLGVLGVIEAARGGKNVTVIPNMSDQYDLAPEVILSSIVLDYTQAILDVVKSIEAGQKTGDHVIKYVNDRARLADYRGKVPESVKAKLKEVDQKMRAAEVTYPTQADLFK
jgi:basic membrane protein A